MQKRFDKTLRTGNFRDKLKTLADITPSFKKNNPEQEENDRPVSVLPAVSKTFERLMQKQVTVFAEKLLSPYLCGYRKGFSTQRALIHVTEKWERILDQKRYGRALLMDLSQASDTWYHDLWLAELYACGFDRDSLNVHHVFKVSEYPFRQNRNMLKHESAAVIHISIISP